MRTFIVALLVALMTALAAAPAVAKSGKKSDKSKTVVVVTKNITARAAMDSCPATTRRTPRGARATAKVRGWQDSTYPWYGWPGFYRGRWNGGGFGPCYTKTPIGPIGNCG